MCSSIALFVPGDQALTAAAPNGNIFTILDEKRHTERRKIISPIYTMSSTLEQEKYIDLCLALFNKNMAAFVESGEVVDLGRWVWKYARQYPAVQC